MNKQIKTTVVKVTPTMCLNWLDKNEDNRALHQNHIALLARTMARKDWVFNGESLKIDIADNVLDGQHRMWACIESKVPFKTMLTINLPRAVFDTIDTGIIRTANDILSIKKEINVAIIVAALKHVGRYYSNTMMALYKFTNREIEDLLEQHPDIRIYAKKIHQKKNLNRWCAGSIVATTWYLASRINRTQADTFFESFLEGSNLDVGSPILVLRNKLIDIHINPLQKLSATHKIQLIILTWNLWRKGKTVKHFRLSTLNVSSADFPSFK